MRHRHREGTLLAVELLGHAIRYRGRPARLTTLRDIAARKATEARLAHQATHDALTGLPNRALFLDRLAQALARARRDARPSARSSSSTSTASSRSTTPSATPPGTTCSSRWRAGCARACARATPLARFGGDEFALLLDDVGDLPGAGRVAERLLAATRAPLPVAGRALVVTLSVGIALRADPADTPAALLRRADAALYRAKGAGRATYAAFDPALDAAPATVRADGP